jgi:hypothetical protein
MQPSLAAEGVQMIEDALPQELKRDAYSVAFAARLKSCPFKTKASTEFFRSL